MLFGTALYFAVLHCVFCAVLCVMDYYTVYPALHCDVLCYIMMCYTVIYFAVLYVLFVLRCVVL